MLPGLAEKSGAEIVELLKASIAEAELTAVADVEAAFQPYGMSAIVVLQESHVAAHCWPEIDKVLVDVHICDYFSDNKLKAEVLCRALGTRFSGVDSLERWHYARIDEKAGS
jgi:S-adenosylmethionine decarboxylase